MRIIFVGNDCSLSICNVFFFFLKFSWSFVCFVHFEFYKEKISESFVWVMVCEKKKRKRERDSKRDGAWLRERAEASEKTRNEREKRWNDVEVSQSMFTRLHNGALISHSNKFMEFESQEQILHWHQMQYEWAITIHHLNNNQTEQIQMYTCKCEPNAVIRTTTWKKMYKICRWARRVYATKEKEME